MISFCLSIFENLGLSRLTERFSFAVNWTHQMDQFSIFFMTVQHTVTCVYDFWKRSATHLSNMSGNTWIAWVPGEIRGRMLLFLGGGAEGRLGASQIEILGFSRTATPLASRCDSAGKKVPRATSIPKERTYYRTSHELFYTVFTHELLTYQKSNEWDFIRSRMSGISDTKTSAYTQCKALSTWYCAYYIHTETFLILATF